MRRRGAGAATALAPSGCGPGASRDTKLPPWHAHDERTYPASTEVVQMKTSAQVVLGR